MNPFNFLPRPGDAIEIPGGMLWCESLEVNQATRAQYDGPELVGMHYLGAYSGEIRFRFQTSDPSCMAPRRLGSGQVAALPDSAARPLLEGGGL